MKRCQVYLNSHSVNVLDDFEKITGISRSQLIREAIDLLSHNLAQILAKSSQDPKKRLKLDSLIGLIKVKGEQKTSFALKSDRDYLGK